MAQESSGGMLSHSVYFALDDNSDAAVASLVADCKQYLSGHPGEVFFAVGTLAEEFNREVNVRDFDVVLLLVFKDRVAHDTYQDSPRHGQFLDRQSANWKTVRVFDAYVGIGG
jgi:hypothetical protein